MQLKKIIVLFIFMNAYADQITVINNSDYDIYGGIYYYPSSYTLISRENIPLATSLIQVPAKSRATIERPDRKWFYNRDFLFSLNKDDLKSNLNRDEYKNMPRVNIGTFQGDTYIINIQDGLFYASTQESSYTLPITTMIDKAKNRLELETFGRLRKFYEDDKSKDKQADVKVGSQLSEGEKQYLSARMSKVKLAQEKLLDLKLKDDEVLKIAFCGSGGGYRAMIATTGSVVGAQKIGLLDASTYFASLSGSTWMLSAWTQMGISPEEFKNQLIPRVKENLFSGLSENVKNIASYLFKKYIFDEPLSLIDLYGMLLANKLLSGLGRNIQDIVLSDQAGRVASGDWIYPIYTAVITKTMPYQWIEFTPHEIGSSYLNSYVPTWAFGRKFLQGKSINFAPEQSLGFFMGIWGSAFSANFKEIYKNVQNLLSPTLANALKYGTQELKFGTMRMYPAKLFNYTRGMLNLPLNQQETITLIDAGLGCNLPAVPLFRKERNIDVMIFLDASQDVNEALELKCAQAYAQANNLKFPPIDYTNIGQKVISVFQDEKDPTVPIVIYMPRIKNIKYSPNFDPTANILSGGYLSTDNFAYTPEQFTTFSGLTEFNMVDSKDIIINVLKNLILSRRKNK